MNWKPMHVRARNMIARTPHLFDGNICRRPSALGSASIMSLAREKTCLHWVGARISETRKSFTLRMVAFGVYAVDNGDVRYGSKPDIVSAVRNIRYTPESGH
jgi:hypothetical protein